MEVILAGYNLDKELIEQLKVNNNSSDLCISPESIAAAYARISRYPDPVTALREKARKDLSKARKSNQRIVFDMGHHSIAEHVMLNFDVLGISRLAIESLEESRLSAYTEKSQRYITLQGDCVTPSEFQNEDLKLFNEITSQQNALYQRALPILHDLQKEKHADMLQDRKGRETVEGWAKEDARFALNLATEGQLGFSTNARNLEYIIRKLRHSRLAEVRDLSQNLYQIGSEIVPSLIILSDPEAFEKQFNRKVSDEFIRNGKEHLQALTDQMFDKYGNEVVDEIGVSKGNVTLLYHTEDPDTKIIAALLHSISDPPESFASCLQVAQEMKDNGNHLTYIKKAFAKLTEYDTVFREFEHTSFTFELQVSASEFAQWKRHRMMTLTKQPYEPELGYTYPESVMEAGLEPDFSAIYEKTTEGFIELIERHPEAAEYILTNGHKRRVLITANMRELYHIARLRIDMHAQWEIQQSATDMIDLITDVAPATALLACGKSDYMEIFTQIYDPATELI